MIDLQTELVNELRDLRKELHELKVTIASYNEQHRSSAAERKRIEDDVAELKNDHRAVEERIRVVELTAAGNAPAVAAWVKIAWALGLTMLIGILGAVGKLITSK